MKNGDLIIIQGDIPYRGGIVPKGTWGTIVSVGPNGSYVEWLNTKYRNLVVRNDNMELAAE